MTKVARIRRLTPKDITSRKGGAPLVCLTAYTAPVARALDPHVDLLLVGDSLGMVLYGLDTTLGVTLDMMIAHGRAVVRASRHACVIVDLPFGSYEESPSQAYRAAARVMAETGAAGVKLEGGEVMADTIRFLTRRGIPVLGHVGLMPQSVNATGGFRVQGKTSEEAARVRADARAVERAGAFGVVIENTVEPLARALTAELGVPTIGIGASVACDGQILVTEDIVGLGGEFVPRFVKRYAALGEGLVEAAKAYADEVRTRRFPGPEQVYQLGPGETAIVPAITPLPTDQRRSKKA
jgi:3-methyl-2-oxobutanoate hydroxymethyltransferase